MPERIVIKDIENSIKNISKINYVERNHITRYQYALKFLKKEFLVVDIACGSGYGSKMMAKHGCKVISIDCSKDAIELCKKYNDHPNITWIVGDIQNFSKIVNENLDAIVCFETLEHIESGQENVLKQFKIKLKSKSPAICSIPLNHPDTVWHKRIFDFESREKLFKSCFDKIEYSNANNSLIVGWNN